MKVTNQITAKQYTIVIKGQPLTICNGEVDSLFNQIEQACDNEDIDIIYFAFDSDASLYVYSAKPYIDEPETLWSVNANDSDYIGGARVDVHETIEFESRYEWKETLTEYNAETILNELKVVMRGSDENN